METKFSQLNVDFGSEPRVCPFTAHSKTTPYSDASFRSNSPTITEESQNSRSPLHAASSSHTLPQSSGQCPIFTQEVDPVLLKTSLEDRIAYLTDFLNFGSRDAEVIKKIAPAVNDIIPELVDGMYKKLFEFDITKKVFMSRNSGFDGPLPNTLEDLTLESAQIVFRKVFLKAWARKVFLADYVNPNGKIWVYMDKVGIMHTGASPFKHQRTMGIEPLNVPYRDCALTLGWIQSLLHTAILRLPENVCSASEKIEAVAAVNKIFWIQNDLFSRHYIGE